MAARPEASRNPSGRSLTAAAGEAVRMMIGSMGRGPLRVEDRAEAQDACDHHMSWSSRRGT